MKILEKNAKTVFLFTVIIVAICITMVLTGPGYARINTNSLNIRTGPWLSQYEDKVVRVTFETVPSYLGTDFSKTTALKIVEAGDAGIVVSFRPNRTVFFPYTQIAAIEPLY